MKIQGHLSDYPLHDLLEILANRHESGCLRIGFEPEPALLYFKRGQLVDARMSFLKGFPAVHLAFSRAEAPFEFDNQIPPPDSAIIDENERLLLSGMLKVRLGGESEIESPPARLPRSAAILAENFSTSNEVVIPKDEPVAAALKLNLVMEEEAKPTQELNATVFAKTIEPVSFPSNHVTPFRATLDSVVRLRATLDSVVRLRAALDSVVRLRAALDSVVRLRATLDSVVRLRATLDSVVRQTWTNTTALRSSLVTVSNYVAGNRLLSIAALIFAIAIPATVGITVLLGKKNTSEQVIAATRQSTSATDANEASVAPKQVEPAVTKHAEPVTTTQKSPVQTPVATNTPATVAATTKSVTKSSLPDTPKIIENQPRQTQTAEPPAPVEQPAPPAESTSKTIVVVVRVEGGRVAEAWVKDSRKGLEAYEATALRQARQRRYPAGASRTESIPVSVTINK